jgi:hypothetical protein
LGAGGVGGAGFFVVVNPAHQVCSKPPPEPRGEDSPAPAERRALLIFELGTRRYARIGSSTRRQEVKVDWSQLHRRARREYCFSILANLLLTADEPVLGMALNLKLQAFAIKVDRCVVPETRERARVSDR